MTDIGPGTFPTQHHSVKVAPIIDRDPGDENDKTTTTTATETHEWLPISVNIDTLRTLSEPQIERLGVLMKGFRADKAVVQRDAFSDKGNVIFTLLENRTDPEPDRVLLGGLIEPDGRAHT